jgi:hypothetical protein
VQLPFAVETDLERRIVADPEWQEGAAWGKPRSGHPEGSIANHVRDVLDNIDVQGAAGARRADLRVIALLHDVMKHRVNRLKPASGENHHAMRARRFAERFLDDEDLLDVIELHDEAYNAWRLGGRRGRWDRAEARAARLLDRLGDRLDLYLAFYRADNASGAKTAEPLRWFEALASARAGAAPR